MISIKKFTFNPFQENSYILYDETKECVIIDPGCYSPTEKSTLLNFISDNDLKPVKLLNTHCHVDHIQGNHIVSKTFNLQLEAHEKEIPVLEGSPAWGLQYGITGDISPDSRSALLTGLEYSNGGGIVMTDVGGEGLDMQFVDLIINHDLPWNPMVLEQRIGRLDRIGRDDRKVEIHNIILNDSLDHHISRVLLEKEALTSKFGGYGISIDVKKDAQIVGDTYNFKTLTSDVFQNDIIGCSTKNEDLLNYFLHQ